MYRKYYCTFSGRDRTALGSNRDTVAKGNFNCSFEFKVVPENGGWNLYLPQKHTCTAPYEFVQSNIGIRRDIRAKIISMYKSGRHQDDIDAVIKTDCGGPASLWYPGSCLIRSCISNY